MKNFSTAFSFFGGKGSIIKKYPMPIYDQIIDPFVGGGSYPLLYYNRKVIINDLNKDVVDAWKFIQSPNEDELRSIPRNIKPGDKISDFGNFSRGFSFILRCNANHGTGGTRKGLGVNVITKFAANRFYYKSVIKVRKISSLIQHWEILNTSYENIENIQGTYFIDPPYQYHGGDQYNCSSNNIDYAQLALWLKSRMGQVIVCENSNSPWISELPKGPFNRLVFNRTDTMVRKKDNESIINFENKKNGHTNIKDILK